MLFTWDTSNLCIVFKWWRIEGFFSLVVSLAAVVIISAGYELVRELSRRYEAKTQDILKTSSGSCTLANPCSILFAESELNPASRRGPQI